MAGLEALGSKRWARSAGLEALGYRRSVMDEASSNESLEGARWQVFGERTLYDNPWVRLVKVDVQPPGGRRFEHHVVRLHRVAITAVVDAADRVLMLWRHRFVTDQWGWELPGGIVDAGENGPASAAREVEEETGWRPGTVSHLLTFQPMIGMVDSPHELYVAHGAELMGEPSDVEEVGRVQWVPLSSILDLMAKGEILGAGSLVALLHIIASRANKG
jgi:8-oxo-dGTP pyrophosphatase MutT (NUDIX family)